MDYPSAVAVSGVHTGFHALLYGVIGFAGAVIGLGRLPLGLGVVLLLSVGLYAASGVLVVLAGINMTLVARFVGVLEAVAERVPRVGDRLAGLVDRVPAFTAAAADAFRALATAPRVVAAYAVAWIVSLVFVPGVRMWLLLESLGAGFEPAVLLPVYLLAAYSVTLLPLTPGGIGVTEATATAVFVALGVPEAVVVPAVFADRLLGAYLPAIVGWYPSLRTDFSALVSE